MNPVNAQQAALRLLLEDVDPLLVRAEEATQTLQRVREQLDCDLQTLTGVVQQSLAAQPAILEAGRRLSASAARIEAALSSGSTPALQAAALPFRWRAAGAVVLSSLLSAALTFALVHAATRDHAEQARLGRALQSVWSALDATAQRKLHAALRSAE
ncbi:MAG: hypothetical protein EOO28_34960 [Comamonadaceae bacterium]|nr:MAG: hypothetical protein EOO28_34960 [Comamonadaceae bacterium]